MAHASGLSDVRNDLHFLKEAFSTSRQIAVELLTAFTQLGGRMFCVGTLQQLKLQAWGIVYLRQHANLVSF